MSDTTPIEHPSWLTAGDFTEADEPLRLFAAWFEEARRAEVLAEIDLMRSGASREKSE